MLLADTQTVPGYVGEILTKYGVEYISIGPGQTGYRNTSYAILKMNGTRCNLIVYKREPGIVSKVRNAEYIAAVASQHGLPVRRQLDQRIIQLSDDEAQPRYAALYNYLPGTTIPWEAYTKTHLKLIGLGLARLHDSFAGQAAGTLPDVIADSQALLRRMQTYFAKPGVQKALKMKLDLDVHAVNWSNYTNVLAATTAMREGMPLHMDFVRGNLLFRDRAAGLHIDDLELSGIIDFEKASFGPAVYDVARTLAFLLVDSKSKTSEQVMKYFLYSGYLKRGGRPVPQQRLLQELTRFYLLHDFYKFLLHNPYESLSDNQHFMRTRDLLLAHGELQAS